MVNKEEKQDKEELDHNNNGSTEKKSINEISLLLTLNSNDKDTIAPFSSLKPEPTDEEMITLRRVPDRLPLGTWLVALVELGERFTFYGVTGPFQNYMQRAREFGHHSGALGLGQSKASTLSYFFQFWCYVTPVFGAIIADSWLGKYKTIFLFSLIYMCGNLILFFSSLPYSLDRGGGLAGLIISMIIIGLGAGGIKSNVSPMISEQYTNTKHYIKTLKSGERVIVDPNVTIQSIFLIFYFCINVGSLSSIATTNLELHVDFWAAFLLPTLFFLITILLLIFGRNIYVKKPPKGPVILHAFRVCIIAARNKFKWDAARPVTLKQSNVVAPWSDSFVDEVRRGLFACKVFAIYPIFWLVYGQMLNNFVSQAGNMDTKGIPNDLMQNINPLSIIIFIPIMERYIYPGLRRIGFKMRPITRIFCGFMFSAFAMAYAAIVQQLIYNSGPCYNTPKACAAGLLPSGNYAPNNVHIAIQSPAYILIAFSEIFASVTGLEYAYTKAPVTMKSFIMSLFLLTNALGAVLGIIISPTAKDPTLVWTYTGLSIATFVSGLLVWFGYRHLNAMEDELNAIDAIYEVEDQNINKNHDIESEPKKQNS